MSYDEEWETGSGFTLDGATATITDMQFGFNTAVSKDASFANMTLEVVEGSESGAPGEVIDQSFSVGGNFVASRDGLKLEGNGKINKQSNYGILIDSVVATLVGAGYDPSELIGSPKEVEGWIGTTWVWGTIERETRNPTTGEQSKKSKFVVTEYVEMEEAEATPAKAPAKAVAKKAPAKKAAAGRKPALPAGLDQEQFDYYVGLAGQYDDHDEFAQAMLEDEDVAASPDLQKAVMSTKPGSIWASK